MRDSTTSIRFRESAARATQDSGLRQALRRATDLCAAKRTKALSLVDHEELREKASAVRLHALDTLPELLDRFSAAATHAGAVVYRAIDAESACDTVFNILRDRGARKIVKSKSMITEEIHLNSYLETRGMQVVETDLGEYIVQLAGECPSHILAPAIHKTRQQIGRLFSEKLGVAYSEDPSVLTKIARKALRNSFLAADAGISGANFAVADTGSLVLFTNEGNGRMATTLPRLHVAVLSLEKMIPSLADLALFMRLLPRSASGQIISSYVSVITGRRKAGEASGADELHIVLLDNGRSQILSGACREILKCIRCSACLNACPVYRTVGGHAYDCTYQGPMGVVLTTLLEGMDRAHSLLDATTLCGACSDVCPVKVPLPQLLKILRERRVDEGFTPMTERLAMAGFGLAAGSPGLFGLAQKALGALAPVLGRTGDNNVLSRLPESSTRGFGRRMR
jgi:L-lactate dehydrogenase complex protein LldF